MMKIPNGWLSPRERCVRCINLEEIDLIPINIRIRPEPYLKLKKALGIIDNDKVLEALGIEFRHTGIGLKGGYEIKGAPVGEEGYLLGKEGGYATGSSEGKVLRRSIFGYVTTWSLDHSYTYSFLNYPLKHMSIDDYRWPEIDENSFKYAEAARRKYEDYCLMGGVVQAFETAWKLTGFTELMRLMHTDEASVNNILDGLFKITMGQAKLLLDAGVDIVYNGDDVGTQTGMMISPKLWRKYLKPKYAELARLIHAKGAHFFFHSDGWIEAIIPDLIEIGVDILNPIQPECMDAANIKRLYGNKLCFDGAISIQRTLPFGSREDVRREVKERIETMGPTGYILAPSHDMQPEVPVENILEFYEAANEYRKIGSDS